jgi:hypothetical protein
LTDQTIENKYFMIATKKVTDQISESNNIDTSSEKVIGGSSSHTLIERNIEVENEAKNAEVLPFPTEIVAKPAISSDVSQSIDEESAKRKTPLFLELAQPKLPELEKENRLYLQIQSPKRIFLYWSVKSNLYKSLQKAFGENANSYSLAAKLINVSKKTEDVFQIEGEGSAWFDVADNTKYQAEVGFFAPNLPFVRIAYSNEIETPRMSPSPNQDTSPNWNVSAMQFAEVLEASGYSQDAFEVALSSVETEESSVATETIFSRISGEPEAKFAEFEMSELRSILMAIAGGIPFPRIVESVSGELSAWLSLNPQVFETNNVMSILQETFGEEFGTFVEGAETETSGVVFGASLVNFGKIRSRFSFPNTKTSSRNDF